MPTIIIVLLFSFLSHSFESLHKFWAGAKETEVVLSEVRVNAPLYGV